MTRPPAIRRFEGLWFGAVLTWLAGLTLSWDARRRMMAATPQLAGYEWLVPAGFGLVLGVALLLWWFTARRPQSIARVGVIAVAALSAMMLVLSLAALGSRALTVPANLLQSLSTALCIGGAVSLFGAGTSSWFDRPVDDVAEVELEP